MPSSPDVVYGAVCFVAGGVIPDAWTVDSGCICHMTNDRKFFNDFNRDVVVEVTLADGTVTKSAGSGSGVLFGVDGGGNRVAIRLENVLFVPSLESGLISVRKLALKGFAVTFEVDGCKIRNADGVVVAVGETVGNQYKLKQSERCNVVMTGSHNDQCQHTWHRRFGHRDPGSLSVLKSKDLVSGLESRTVVNESFANVALRGS